MTFRINGLAPLKFEKLYGLTDAQLAQHGAERYVVDAFPGYPDRVELRDAEPGETVLLLNYVHQPAANPYRAGHAIYVLEGARQAWSGVGCVPEVLQRRTLSLRAFDADHRIVDATLVDGRHAAQAIQLLLSNPHASYLHAHYAARGCYAAYIERH